MLCEYSPQHDVLLSNVVIVAHANTWQSFPYAALVIPPIKCLYSVLVCAMHIQLCLLARAPENTSAKLLQVVIADLAKSAEGSVKIYLFKGRLAQDAKLRLSFVTRVHPLKGSFVFLLFYLGRVRVGLASRFRERARGSLIGYKNASPQNKSPFIIYAE